MDLTFSLTIIASVIALLCLKTRQVAARHIYVFTGIVVLSFVLGELLAAPGYGPFDVVGHGGVGLFLTLLSIPIIFIISEAVAWMIGFFLKK